VAACYCIGATVFDRRLAEIVVPERSDWIFNSPLKRNKRSRIPLIPAPAPSRLNISKPLTQGAAGFVVKDDLTQRSIPSSASSRPCARQTAGSQHEQRTHGAKGLSDRLQFQVIISARLALLPLIATSGTVTLGEAWRSTLCRQATEATTPSPFNRWSA
jgi:hypothetical protein